MDLFISQLSTHALSAVGPLKYRYLQIHARTGKKEIDHIVGTDFHTNNATHFGIIQVMMKKGSFSVHRVFKNCSKISQAALLTAFFLHSQNGTLRTEAENLKWKSGNGKSG